AESPIAGLAAEPELSDGGEDIHVEAAHIDGPAAARHDVARIGPGDAKGPCAAGQREGAGKWIKDGQLFNVIRAEDHVVEHVKLRVKGDIVIDFKDGLDPKALLSKQNIAEAVVAELFALRDVRRFLRVEVETPIDEQ